jgi:CspA family cold shock protein
MRGTIKRVIHERGFGFIQTENGEQVFFHLTGLAEPIFQDLRRGEAVEFELIQDHRGPRAVHIRLAPSPAERSGGTFDS